MRNFAYLLVAVIGLAGLPAAAATITVGNMPLVHPANGVDRGSLSVTTPDGWWDTVHGGALDGSGFTWAYNPVDPVRGFAKSFSIDNVARDNMTKILTITVIAKAEILTIGEGETLKTRPGDFDFWPVYSVISPFPPAWLVGASKFKLVSDSWEAQFQYWLRPQPPGEYVSFQAFALAGDIPNVSSVKIDITCVPEPSAWAMLIIGFGAVGGMQRRRRNIAAA